MGGLLVGFGAACLASPGLVQRTVDFFLEERRLLAVSAMRVVLGVVFVGAAPASRIPWLLVLLGAIAVVAGVAIPLMGVERVRPLAERFTSMGDAVLRGWAILAMGMGGLLVWVAI